MAKHTLKEILALFAKGAEHTHEAACQATYDAGHAAGRADAQAEFTAGLGSPAPAPTPPEGATTDGDEEKDAESGEAEALEVTEAGADAAP